MYGWRGRIGLIVPSSNTTMEPDLYRSLPPGVSVHTSRMFLKDTTPSALEEMTEEVERCAKRLRTADVDVVAYGCTTGSLLKGVGYDQEIEARIEEITGAPAVSTAGSVRRALEALEAESLVITTPYIEELNEDEREFLEELGYEVTDIEGLHLQANLDIGALQPETAYQRASEIYDDGADVMFISCTNYRSMELAGEIERDLGCPVITSNLATTWDVFNEMDVDAGHFDTQLFAH